jgi:hypothetical protein
MAIVMGLDQHRAQITAEWIDTETGEVSRGRITPADRQGVVRFLERFAGLELEVALEATTGRSPPGPTHPLCRGRATRLGAARHDCDRPQLYSDTGANYLMSHGIREDEASKLIINGFHRADHQGAPMEYAVEMNRLIELQMKGSIG